MFKNIGIFLASVGAPLALVVLVVFLVDDGKSGGNGAGIVAWFGYMWFLLAALVASFIAMVRVGTRCRPDKEGRVRFHFSNWEKFVLSNALACVVVMLCVLYG